MNVNDWTATIADCLHTLAKATYTSEKAQAIRVLGSSLTVMFDELNAVSIQEVLAINALSLKEAQQYIAIFASHAQPREVMA